MPPKKIIKLIPKQGNIKTIFAQRSMRNEQTTAEQTDDEGRDKHGGGQVPPEQGKTYVNHGQEDEMEISGFSPSRVKTVATWIFIVLTVGLLRLVFYWKPSWMLQCTHSKCSLLQATSVLLKDQYLQLFVEKVLFMTLDNTRSSSLASNEPSGNHGNNKLPVSGTVAAQQMADGQGLLRYFVSKKVMYLWSNETGTFTKLMGLDHNQTCSFFHEATPLTIQQEQQRRHLYGENLIDVRVDSIIKLLVTQGLNPFYIFQLFSCILWYFDVYYYYATAIVIMSVVSLTAEIYQTRTMQRALKSTISGSDVVSVFRSDDQCEDMPSDLLAPGDIIEVPRHGCTMQCDAVLLTGNCIVNESMLTGESVPVTKTPLPNPQLLHGQPSIPFSLKEHGRHTLFCGTHVIQTRYYGKQKVKAVVIRTGFSTAKGELVRSIMFPKPLDFKFARDTYKFIGVLAGIASIGMIYTVVVMTQDGEDGGTITKRMLDLITIVIPPALPAAMTIGTVFAQRRLKKSAIFCISPKSITLCGTINTFCFDKTGTLTEDGLDMRGVVPVEVGRFKSEEKHVPNLGQEPIMLAMATCHSLTIIEGELTGDPLDLRMFESTQWLLEEPGEDTSKFDVFMPTLVRPKTPDLVRASQNFGSSENIPFEVGILRQFTFSSKLQRMSVIARTLSKPHFDLYSKGAPEMIASLCKPETVPKDFHDVLLKYTQHGYRVLALAWKPLRKLNYVKVQRAQREQMECDLTFLGLLVMENRLKPMTTPIIHQLKEAKIRTVMVTGDNMLTAISVARDCRMINPRDKVILVHVVPPRDGHEAFIEWNYAEDTSADVKEIMTKRLQSMTTVVQMEHPERVHFAITGTSWQQLRQYFPDLIHKLVVRGTVFARFSPEQKQQLIEALQELGYYVGMCGDGANDCGALKTAHTGISLSEAEASVASPFTSKTPDISCVPRTVREGRAALVTSFGVFKYMAGYSMTQFLTVCMLYWVGANLSDFTFLYIDLFIITTLGATFGYTAAYPTLVAQAPPISLVSAMPIISIIIHLLIITAFQVFMWFLVRMQPWFVPFIPNEDDDYTCYEHTALFSISSFQYVTLAIVFSKASPYRKNLFTNKIFLANIVVLTALNLWVVVYPTAGFADFLDMKEFPSLPFRGFVVGLAIANFFICFIVEVYLLESDFIQRRCHASLEERNKHKNKKYLLIEEELRASPEWPPISQSTHSLADLMRLESMPQQAKKPSHSLLDDEEGEDDVMGCSTGLRASLRKKRRRNKSSSSMGSRVSADESFESGKPDRPTEVVLGLPGDVSATYRTRTVSGSQWDSAGFDDRTPILQAQPDSPTSPTSPSAPLTGGHGGYAPVSSNTVDIQPLHVEPHTVAPDQVVMSAELFSGPRYPDETQL